MGGADAVGERGALAGLRAGWDLHARATDGAAAVVLRVFVTEALAEACELGELRAERLLSIAAALSPVETRQPQGLTGRWRPDTCMLSGGSRLFNETLRRSVVG
ncbi:UNVERIFIED_CONTAM: hypothetical protein RKD50_009247 [Streptomyces canus]